MDESKQQNHTTYESKPQQNAEGGSNVIANRGSASIGGDVIDSRVTIQNIQNINIITPGGWELPGGDKLLSATQEVEETISELHKALPQEAQEDKGAIETTFAGPVLLRELLTHYQIYRQQWQEAALPEESAKDASLKCFNQGVVMLAIRAPESSARVVELSGPSGIGKSHVLKGLRNEEDRERLGIPPEKWGKWRYAYVEGHSSSVDRIMSDLMKELRSCHKPADVSPKDLAQCLGDLFERERINRVLFAIDSVDKVSDEVLARLIGDEGPAGEHVREELGVLRDHMKLQLVITTRRPRLPSLLKQYDIWNTLALQMDALKFEDVRDMLAEQIKHRLGDEDYRETINVMAGYIFGTSGGYPRAISVILRKLTSEHFTGRPEKFPERFQPLVRRIVQRDIIGDLSMKEYLLLNVLSVFRHFHASLVRQLMKRKLLPDNLMGDQEPTEVSITHWLNSLCETPALIRRNTSDPSHPFAVHPVLRHVLPMDLEANSPHQLYRLHLEAHRTYDCGLRERDRNGLRLCLPLPTRAVCTMEALYHAVQCRLVKIPEGTAPEPNPPDPLGLAEEYWHLYVDSYIQEADGFQRDPFALYDQWQQDTELQNRIRHLPDGDKSLETFQHMLNRDPYGSPIATPDKGGKP